MSALDDLVLLDISRDMRADLKQEIKDFILDLLGPNEPVDDYYTPLVLNPDFAVKAGRNSLRDELRARVEAL